MDDEQKLQLLEDRIAEANGGASLTCTFTVGPEGIEPSTEGL